MRNAFLNVSIFAALLVAALVATPGTARAQFRPGDWDLTLNGSGSNDKDFNTGGFAGTVGLGNFVTPNVEVGVRQGLGISSNDNDTNLTGNTSLAVDFHFLNADSKVVPFVGGTIGYAYGDGVDDHWAAGPEAGVKWFLNQTTYVYGSVGYQFDLDQGLDAGSFQYGLGLGLRF
jgi:outer membrane protein W